MSDHPEQLVIQLWNAVWIDRDREAMRDLLAEPYIRHGREGTTTSGPDDYATRMLTSLKHLKGADLRVDDIASVGDMVYARMHMGGVNLETGNAVSISWLGHYRVHKGKIAESWMLHQTDLDWA